MASTIACTQRVPSCGLSAQEHLTGHRPSAPPSHTSNSSSHLLRHPSSPTYLRSPLSPTTRGKAVRQPKRSHLRASDCNLWTPSPSNNEQARRCVSRHHASMQHTPSRGIGSRGDQPCNHVTRTHGINPMLSRPCIARAPVSTSEGGNAGPFLRAHTWSQICERERRAAAFHCDCAPATVTHLMLH